MSNSSKPWSNKDLCILKEYLLTKNTGELPTLADQLNRSKAAVKNKLRQLKRNIHTLHPSTDPLSEAKSSISKPLDRSDRSVRSVYIWHSITDDSPAAVGIEEVPTAPPCTAMAIASDVEKAKILIVQELESTGLWISNIDLLVEQLNTKRYSVHQLDDFAHYF